MLKVSFKQNGNVFTVLCYDVEVKPIIACPQTGNIASNMLMLNIGTDKYYQPVIYESESGKELRYNRHHEEVFISIDACSIKITPQKKSN